MPLHGFDDLTQINISLRGLKATIWEVKAIKATMRISIKDGSLIQA